MKLTVRAVLSTLPSADRAKLILLAAARVLANGFDILGLAGIALLATSFSTLASGQAGIAPVTLPVFGQIVLSESQAVLVALVIVGLFVLKSFFSVWLGLLTNLTLAKLEGHYVRILTRQFFSQGSSEEGTQNETVSRFQNNILVATSGIQTYLNSIISLLTESTFLFVMLSAFLIVNPIVAASLFVYMTVILFLLSRLVNYRVRRNSRLGFSGSETSLNTSRELFSVRREVELAGRLDEWLQRILEGKMQAANSSAINGVLAGLPRHVIETSLLLGIFAFLGGVVIFSDLPSQAVTIGVFLAGGLRLVASILPIQAATQSMIGSAAVAQNAFGKIILAQNQSPKLVTHDELDLTDFSPTLEFSSVSFGFKNSDVETLSGVSFRVEAKSKSAIVGPSGAGKTTAFEIATGFRVPASGMVRIGGMEPRRLSSQQPGLIGIVPQRPHLISGTLAENIALSTSSSIDVEKVRTCLELAGLSHFIINGKLNLDSKISPDFGEFSGGEIQRLGLARALYRDPKILFLDEATSALDAETESKVNQTLDKLRGNMTIVLIAHRLSTVMNADNIIYLDKGKVVAQGTFQELKAKVPDFAKAVELMDLRD